MKKNNYLFLLAFFLNVHFLSAQKIVLVKENIKLTSVDDSPLFPTAKLILNTPLNNSKEDKESITFNYILKNYKLTEQTSDASNKHCNNSDKGQHIHLILNNEPYLAKYETTFSENLKPGNYIALSFLSRSYHESLKHKKAYDLRQFDVGNTEQKKYNLKTPMLFYSRPKGEYVDDDTKKILLDFYIVNCKLSAKGLKVKATINDKEFILTKWTAFAIEGLPMGESTIKLELLDKNGIPLEGDFTKSTRTIILKESK